MAKSYYKKIQGVRYDRALLESAEERIKGQGDGRISDQDIHEIIDLSKDGNKVTLTELRTIKYIRDHFRVTEKAQKTLSDFIIQIETSKSVPKEKKDLIITSGGDNISGQRIENILMSFNEISQLKSIFKENFSKNHFILFGINKISEREKGIYNWTGPSEYFVEVDLPIEERDAGYPEDPLMHVALWMPDVPPGTLVPVIATIHPYYEFAGSNPNTIPDLGIGQWVLEEFVPHGYALAQISTFGSGKSTHCQDVKGLGEQIGIQAAVDWLGKQPWSNGNVGLMGKSYAGTTNWEAAQNPSPHLKTIVPISGSIGVREMFYRNGSSESRAMLYDALYEGATAGASTDDMRMCTDDAIGPASPWTTYALAEYGGDQWNDYWEERYHLQDVLDNYNGSVYIVWGLQDWNVDPYHAFPTYQMLRDKGLNVKGIMGQWGHNYPDQPNIHENMSSGYGAEAFPKVTRMDWSIELYNWFNYYLKGIGPEPQSQVQIQRNDGEWHVEETWPSLDVKWDLHDVSTWGNLGTVSSSSSITLSSQPLESEMHISGLPTFHAQVRANSCNGGQLFVTMSDGTSGLRLGHATMDLRYRDGGYEAKSVTPFSSYTMKMEFNPMDVVIPEGHTIQLEISDAGEDYLPSTCASAGVTLLEVEQPLSLPLIDRSANDERWFEVPPWWETL